MMIGSANLAPKAREIPNSDSKIGQQFNFQLKASIIKSIFCENCLKFLLGLMVCESKLHQDVITVHQVSGYPDYDVL